jgi:hypothetical protein
VYFNFNSGKKEDLITRLVDFEDLHGPSSDDVTHTHTQHTQSKNKNRNSDQNLKKILGPKNYFLDESVIQEENDENENNENTNIDIYNDDDSFQFDDSDEETERILEKGKKIKTEKETRDESGSKKITLNKNGNNTFGLSLLLNQS